MLYSKVFVGDLNCKIFTRWAKLNIINVQTCSGHPLVDIQANVSQDFLDKYDLEPDNTILAEKKHLPIYEDLSNKFNVKYIPGGTTLNTVRVAQVSTPLL